MTKEGETMKTAAVIIAAGLMKCEGVPASMYKVGTASSAQHMVASFQKAGISPVVLVLDENSKKLEKQLGSSGALFLRCEDGLAQCIKLALDALPREYERLFFCTAGRPFIMPESFELMLARKDGALLAACKGRLGPLLLLSRKYADKLCQSPARSLTKAAEILEPGLCLVETEDPGLLLTPRKAAEDEAALEKHQTALTRPLLDISVTGEKMLLGSKLIKLLRLVDTLRSVRAACEVSGMSYSIAWNLLNSAEEQLGYPLITRNQGGRSGSGSELTDKGRSILSAYSAFESAMNVKMNALYEECFGNLI